MNLDSQSLNTKGFSAPKKFFVENSNLIEAKQTTLNLEGVLNENEVAPVQREI